VKKISQEIRGPQIAGLSRTTPTDIDRAWEALRYARNRSSTCSWPPRTFT